MSGLFLACSQSGVSEKALEFVRNFCRRVFALELNRTDGQKTVIKYTPDMGRKRFLPLTHALSDCFVSVLAESKQGERSGLGELLATIVTDFRSLSATPEFSGKIDASRSADRMIQSFSHRFVGLCHEGDWSRKMAGVSAISILVHKPDIGRKLLTDLEIDLIRALLFCLRDAPQEAPSTSEEVVELMKHLIRTCQSNEDGRSKLPRLTETLVIELNSQSPLSRSAAQQCIEILGHVASQAVPDLIGSTAKSKLLDASAGPIFSKPLRALPIPMQVGNIEAVTYLMELRPSIIETTEEFVRLLHEVLALADVDDASIISKPATHKADAWLKTLRIACLRLLRSAMATPDFLGKPNLAPVRSR